MRLLPSSVTSLFSLLFLIENQVHANANSKHCQGTYIFIRTPGYRWTGKEIAIRSDLSKRECMSACVAHPSCHSLQYWPQFTRCELLPASLVPGAELIPQENVDNYQAACLRNFDANTVCSESFIRWPQRALIGFAELVRDHLTLEQCLAACMDKSSCKSVMFFYNDNQCVLNGVSKDNETELFANLTTKDDLVDYLQPACVESWSSWSLWSDCQPNGYRMRQRACRIESRCKGRASESNTCNLAVIDPNRGRKDYLKQVLSLPADLQPGPFSPLPNLADFESTLPTPPPFSPLSLISPSTQIWNEYQSTQQYGDDRDSETFEFESVEFAAVHERPLKLDHDSRFVEDPDDDDDSALLSSIAPELLADFDTFFEETVDNLSTRHSNEAERGSFADAILFSSQIATTNSFDTTVNPVNVVHQTINPVNVVHQTTPFTQFTSRPPGRSAEENGQVPRFVEVLKNDVHVELPTAPPHLINQILATIPPKINFMTTPLTRTGKLILANEQEYNAGRYRRSNCKEFTQYGYNNYGDCVRGFFQFTSVTPARIFKGKG